MGGGRGFYSAATIKGKCIKKIIKRIKTPIFCFSSAIKPNEITKLASHQKELGRGRGNTMVYKGKIYEHFKAVVLIPLVPVTFITPTYVYLCDIF